MDNLLLKAIFNVLKARMVKHFLLGISLLVIARFLGICTFFQLSFLPRLMLCFSMQVFFFFFFFFFFKVRARRCTKRCFLCMR